MHRLGYKYYMASIENRRERDALISHVSSAMHDEFRLEDIRHEYRGTSTWGRTLFVMGLMASLSMTLVALSWAK